ncbi:hypothetical protein Mal4_34170 [Maioricimonas rarisocia]|uniref:Manganese transport protein MntH n=1 Tax=Maioricimonas rarisocia TaxID=2528026 RepID=A0A517Z9C8_9PLAN|nr:Nramp family divalent metal transporter [Maioricimonas rarisocia]QDU39082.1 hypothetical protein Mal4_34170 [Maioricimonas rarisocia]
MTSSPTPSAESPSDHGHLPEWRTEDLPEPLPFSFGNALRTIGPGAILLVGSIGGGEWIVGPMMTVQYGTGILWIATLGIALQALFNLEAVRYTLYTGEPILTGVMRLSPGPRMWAPFYILIGVAQLATPAVAAGCAAVLFGAFAGRMPVDSDQTMLSGIGVVVILAAAALLVSGRSIERMLERISWAMIAFIFSFLILANLLCVPWETWQRSLSGFVTPQRLPEDINLVMLGLFAATAGSGGLGNLAISNWFRDKGFAMGAHVGGIGGALAHDHQELKSVGAVFPMTDDNHRRWKTWWRYARLDQQVLWGIGCLVGMFLNVNLAVAIVPPETQLSGVSAGAFQADYLARQFGQWLWLLTLLNGFWILFSTHMGNTDILVRTTADILWAASPKARRHSASRLYAMLLGGLTVWALITIHLGNALELFKVLGIVASPIMAFAAIQILRVNTRFLPPELRPPMWRRVALLGSVVVYGGISVALFMNLISS